MTGYNDYMTTFATLQMSQRFEKCLAESLVTLTELGGTILAAVAALDLPRQGNQNVAPHRR